MREEKELICIGCPMGCMMKVQMEDEKVMNITGNTCKRGATYAAKEVINPTRILTTSVRVKGRDNLVVPVKTSSDIPKDKIFFCVSELKKISVDLPVRIGDVVYKNIAGTGSNVIVTKNVDEEKGDLH